MKEKDCWIGKKHKEKNKNKEKTETKDREKTNNKQKMTSRFARSSFLLAIPWLFGKTPNIFVLFYIFKDHKTDVIEYFSLSLHPKK